MDLETLEMVKDDIHKDIQAKFSDLVWKDTQLDKELKNFKNSFEVEKAKIIQNRSDFDNAIFDVECFKERISDIEKQLKSIFPYKI